MADERKEEQQEEIEFHGVLADLEQEIIRVCIIIVPLFIVFVVAFIIIFLWLLK